FAEAISCWERVIELSPGEQPTAYLGLGMALQEEGRLAEAMERYEAAIQLQPDFAEAYLHIGGVHELLGRMDDAEAAFRNALRLQPDH
ncbi:tetratricopeptide repeat protein, partial [Pseudomonas aeruginosa]|uniref:tetratricopeptide repeat protein n=1 Tax=Pseudomonas aeruginosa TaxID=287 RepID=UPI003459AE39